MKVPDILVSGNHEEIKSWRKKKSIERTLERRGDLISTEKYKKFLQTKETKKDSNQLIKFQMRNENDFFYDP